MGNPGGEDSRQGDSMWTNKVAAGGSHICVQINQEEQLGSEIDYATQGSCVGKESLKTSGCKNLWVLQQGKKLPAS